jgi:lipoate-protein ligase A
MVRRPSGGQAVLHAGGLTYALIWPSAPRRRKQAYREACQWLIDGFTQLGLPLRFGDDPALAGDSNCFASATAADLVDPAGVKRIGSAQCWQRGRLLQHGEILLDPPPELWQLVFGEAAPPAAAPAIDRLRLEQQLIEAMAMAWPEVSWKELPLSEDERDQVEARSRSDGSEVAAIDSTI